MRQYLIATAALGLLALSGCETTPDCNDSGCNEAGCSDTAVVPGSEADFKKSVKDRIFFNTNKANLDAEDHDTIKGQAEWLAKWPSVNATVEGHADERGTTEYNMALGERRAHAAKKALVKAGVDHKRLETVSYGKEHPEALGHDEAAWKQNRRAVTVIR